MLLVERPFQSLPSLDDVLFAVGLVGGLDRLVSEQFFGGFGILRVEVAAEPTTPAVWLEILPVDIEVAPQSRFIRNRAPFFESAGGAIP